ncbi:MAG: hypothetical protein K9N55_16880 [Phycisphaerae bacterium]|nr:hypothetical protein [Phycisphaerae bacterium]
MRSLDTQTEANQVLLKLIRKKTCADKVQEVFDAYSTGRLLAMAGIRQRCPEATDQEVWEKWAQQHLGATLYKEVYGNISRS